MTITIVIKCPHCHSPTITRNGKKGNHKQNYLGKDRGRQFISDHEISYQGCLSGIVSLVKIMLVRGIGIRDISTVLRISITKVLKILKSAKYKITPKFSHYDYLEIDEFWTYVGKKKNKVWLIYAYHRESGEIVAYVWGKRDIKTAQKLRKRIKRLGISYERTATDGWDSFLATFGGDAHLIGKKYTVGIEGNNCRMRHRIRRAFRMTCCFSKKLFNHLKAFEMAFFYINYGFV
ncbi:MAG: IS1 family transposase [Treponema sp.]|jgi:IS1 family transposase/transposase-like protein|nr:IS1 family transposase [Treponema sp.]